ncbi:hypothetical protein FPV67DRAFT_1635616 [Lyophyllum atratum]|nr:hypothetical protein FPV67DRAFT_1635616 [Lyophyllum atratum]
MPTVDRRTSGNTGLPPGKTFPSCILSCYKDHVLIEHSYIKGRSCLGTVVHQKTSTVLAIQDVKSEDQRELATLVSAAKANLYEDHRRQWGGGLRGNKSKDMLRKRAKESGQSISVASIQKL